MMRQVTRHGLITVAATGGMLAALSGGTAYADAGAQGAATNSPGVLSGNAVQVPVNVPVNVCGNTINVVGLLNPAYGNACVNDGAGHHGAGHQAGGGHHDPSGHHAGGGQQGAGHHAGGAQASGVAANSPGVGSGNAVQIPVDVPVNVCGNGITAIGALNPVSGNHCVNGSDGGHQHGHHPGGHKPPADCDHHGHHPGDHGHPGHHPGRPGDHGHHGHHPGHHGHHPGHHGDCPGGPETDQPSTPPGKPGDHPGKPVTHVPSDTQVKPQGAPEQRAELAHTGAGYGLGVAAPLSAGLIGGGFLLYRRARVARR